MKKISIIVPCYNEEQAIPFFYEEINKVSISLKYDFEFIFVNDGSKDQTIEINLWNICCIQIVLGLNLPFV